MDTDWPEVTECDGPTTNRFLVPPFKSVTFRCIRVPIVATVQPIMAGEATSYLIGYSLLAIASDNE
jgi:hypothetical protein